MSINNHNHNYNHNFNKCDEYRQLLTISTEKKSENYNNKN